MSLYERELIYYWIFYWAYLLCCNKVLSSVWFWSCSYLICCSNLLLAPCADSNLLLTSYKSSSIWEIFKVNSWILFWSEVPLVLLIPIDCCTDNWLSNSDIFLLYLEISCYNSNILVYRDLAKGELGLFSCSFIDWLSFSNKLIFLLHYYSDLLKSV